MTDDLEIPAALRRDANNVAPFMRRPDCTCGLMRGECKRAGCPINPAANLLATAPSWVPPWEAKS